MLKILSLDLFGAKQEEKMEYRKLKLLMIIKQLPNFQDLTCFVLTLKIRAPLP
jgi:hypothetical protein